MNYSKFLAISFSLFLWKKKYYQNVEVMKKWNTLGKYNLAALSSNPPAKGHIRHPVASLVDYSDTKKEKKKAFSTGKLGKLPRLPTCQD